MTLRQQFHQPPTDYSLVPFWFWNGDLDEAELVRQLDLMIEQGVTQVILHARQGLEVPYLSEAWMQRVRRTVEAAAERGVGVWIYDEDNWPSGYAGGRTLAGDERGRAKNLARRLVGPDDPLRLSDPTPTLSTQRGPNGEGVLVRAVAYRTTDAGIDPETLSDVTDDLRAGRRPSGTVALFERHYTNWHPAYSDDWYVDLLDEAVVRRFLEVTHEAYVPVIGEFFGSTVRGFFTDEPGFYNNFWDRNLGTVPWCDDFLLAFQARKGYDLSLFLPLLWEEDAPNGQLARQTRYDFYDVLSQLYEERFFRPLHDWCEARGLQSIGHVNNEEHLKDHVRYSGDFFRAMRSLHIPGIDLIGGRSDYPRWPDSFVPKLVSSAAHVQGRTRCLSETYGVFGWDLTLEEMKQTADWQFVRGVNLLIPHAFYYSIEGERREECPPSEFFQNTFWPHFRHFADYLRRWSWVLCQGTHVAPVALYYPLASVRAELTPTYPHTLPPRRRGPETACGGVGVSEWGSERFRPDEIDAAFREIADGLFRQQIDFDLLDDDTLAGGAEVEAGTLRVRDERYRVVVLPPLTTLPAASLRRLLAFGRTGGTLVAFNRPIYPCRLEEAEAFRSICAELFDAGTQRAVGRGRTHLVASLDAEALTVIRLAAAEAIPLRIEPPTPQLTSVVRRTSEATLGLLVNESPEPVEAQVFLRGWGRPEQWDLETGAIRRLWHWERTLEQVRVPLRLPGYGTTVLALVEDEEEAEPLHVTDTDLPEVTECVRLDADTLRVVGWANRSGRYRLTLATPTSRIDAAVEVLADFTPLTLDAGWRLTLGGETHPTALGWWSEQGYPHFSGTATYTATFTLPDDWPGDRTVLDLGEVRDLATVTLNGQRVGTRCWRPYEFDVTAALCAGNNELHVEVTNTPENAFHQNPVPSGLRGPVRLAPWAWVEVSVEG